MANEDDILKEAIAGTEKEIFNEAVGKDAPSEEGGPGDRSVEEMGEGLEGQHEPENPELEATGDGEDGEGDDADEGDGADQGEGDGKTVVAKDGEVAPKAGEPEQPETRTRVPVRELLTERKARQVAETALETERNERAADRTKYNDDLSRINQRLDQLASGQTVKATPQTEQTAAEAGADDVDRIFTDPKGFVADLRKDVRGEVTQEFSKRFLNNDFARAADLHKEKFTSAYKALTSQDTRDPVARATVAKIWNSDTPAKDLMDWHAEQETKRLIGNDPAAYAAKVEADIRAKLAKDPEFRKQVVTGMRTDAGGAAPAERQGTQQSGGTPRAVFRGPRSLNGAGGGGQQSERQPASAGGSTDRDVFNDAFRP